MIFPSRKRGGPDPFLDWKVRFFFVGALLAILGIGMKSSLLVGLALTVLLAGIFAPSSPEGEWRRESG